MTRLALAAIAVLLSSACGGDSSDNGSRADSGSSDSGALCTSSAPCPAGQFCFNGLCAIGCNSDGDCAPEQYCDTEFDRLCHNRTVTTCPDVPCESNQVCVQGFCSTPPPNTQCQPSPDGSDGCDMYSICVDRSNSDEPDYACHTFPPCPADGTCPVGTVGAICNDGIVPNKAHICLTGLCQTSAHCPAAWSCVTGSPSDVVGLCSDGSLGSACTLPSHCMAPYTCQTPFPGEIGFCF